MYIKLQVDAVDEEMFSKNFFGVFMLRYQIIQLTGSNLFAMTYAKRKLMLNYGLNFIS